jgi:hypothetical protein
VVVIQFPFSGLGLIGHDRTALLVSLASILALAGVARQLDQDLVGAGSNLIVYWCKMNPVVICSDFGLFRNFLLFRFFVMAVFEGVLLLFGYLAIELFGLFLFGFAVELPMNFIRACFKG